MSTNNNDNLNISIDKNTPMIVSNNNLNSSTISIDKSNISIEDNEKSESDISNNSNNTEILDNNTTIENNNSNNSQNNLNKNYNNEINISVKNINKKNKKEKKNIVYGTVDSFINKVGITPYTMCIIFVFSLLLLVDGGEMTVVSLLITKLDNDWKLNEFEKGLMGATIFMGFFFGTLISGKLSDIYGRKPLYLVGIGIVCLFAIVSAFSPNYVWFTIFRGFCGLGVGLSLPASAALSTEICPAYYRGILINILAIFFPLGEIITALVAKSIINTKEDGWRYLLALIAIPMVIAFILSLLIRESPRYLANNKQFSKAYLEIERLLNNQVKLTEEDKNRIASEVNIASENANIESNYSSLFKKTYLRLNLSVCFILFSCSFIYYGVIYVLPQGLERNINNFNKIDNVENYKLIHTNTNITSYNNIRSFNSLSTNITIKNNTLFSNLNPSSLNNMPTEPLSNNISNNISDEDLDKIFDGVIYSALSEIPAPIVAVFLVNIPILGRRYAMAIGFMITGIFAIMCMQFNNNLVIWASLLKFGINIPFSIGYLYVSEAFPTKIRSIAIGFTNSFTRIGGILTPIISQWMFDLFYTLPYMLFIILAFMSSLVSFSLKIETYGRVLE